MSQQLLASASRTTGATSKIQRGGGRDILLNINVAAITATPSVSVLVENYAGNDQWVTAFTLTAPLTAVGQVVVLLRRLLGAVQNTGYYTQVAEVHLADQWRVRTVHADADAITYSIDVA